MNVRILSAALLMLCMSVTAHAENAVTAFGVDLDFYTGPITREVWFQMKDAGQKLAVVQAWGGRSRNEFAVSQLSGARTIAGMATAAYILLNFDDKVCPTFAHPVRDNSGKCAGALVAQERRGARWQVRQGIAALGSELSHVAFIALDVEWFLSAAPSADAAAQARRRQHILDAIDEVRDLGKRLVIYTRNSKLHWHDITGCDADSAQGPCGALSKVVNDPVRPIPLWDVQTGDPELTNFEPYAEWTERVGRQYQLDVNSFGLPPGRTVDLNVFHVSLFSPPPPRTTVSTRTKKNRVHRF